MNGPNPFATAHETMVRVIEARGIREDALLAALRAVPRHLFIDDPALLDEAYADRAVPAGERQTISQPYVVAVMTLAARPPRAAGYRDARVLEVGTGSGYAAAILAELGANVVSIERHASLSASAAAHLAAAGYPDVRLEIGDGTRGWPAGAPYDAVLVTAGGPQVPQPLVDQLHPDGGRLVLPVGSRQHQVLVRIERRGDASTREELEGVVFVPLIGTFGVPED